MLSSLRCPCLSLLLLSGISVSPPDVTARDNLCAHVLYCLTITSECACCFRFAVVFCMPILGESDK